MRKFGGNRHLILLAGLALLLLFADLSKGDLAGYDDALYAHEGRHMVESGDWWTIQFNGYNNYEYPPLFIWLEAASMKIWGFTDFAAKFPTAVLAFGLILLTYFVTLELTQDVWLSRTAFVVLATTPYFMKYAKHAMTDVPCAFFFAAALLLYLKAYRNRRLLLLWGVPIGLAILTRSVIGLLIFPICLGHMMAARRWDLLKTWHWAIGFAIALGIPSVWYVSQYHLYGEAFLAGHFAFIGSKISSEAASSHFEYLKLMLRLYWPWLPLLVIGFVGQVRQWFRARDFCAAFLLSWALWIVVPFSFAALKGFRYLMPAFPAFAIFAAIPINHWLTERRKQQWFNGLVAAGIVAVIIMLFVPMVKLRSTDMKLLGPIAAAHLEDGQRVMIYSGGRMDFDYQNTLLWYGNRNVDLMTNLDEVHSRLLSGKNSIAIIDKGSMTGIQAHVLGESEHFVCVKGN